MSTSLRHALAILMIPFWVIVCIVVAFMAPDEFAIERKGRA